MELYSIFHPRASRFARLHGLDPDCNGVRRATQRYLNGEKLGVDDLKYLACGSNTHFTVYDPYTGCPRGEKRGVYFNYAATKPLLAPVADYAFYLQTKYRANVGRGSGPKAEVMTEELERTRRQIGQFVGYDPAEQVVVFVPNTSYGMNLLATLAQRIPHIHSLVSRASHHSTGLPPRYIGPWEFFNLDFKGMYDLNDLEQRLAEKSRTHQVLIWVETQSNLTGYKFPYREVCKIAAKYSAMVFLDHAQGASSIKINLKELPGRVFVVMSGHKLYAPDGSGAVIGPRDFFAGPAVYPAGGTISGVTDDDAYFHQPPACQEPGTPAYVAQTSLGKATVVLDEAGLGNIAQREKFLSEMLWRAMSQVEGVETLGASSFGAVPMSSIVSFNLYDFRNNRIPPGFVGAILAAVFGLDFRVGEYCAHPYSGFLQGASTKQVAEHARLHQEKDIAGCAALPGDEWIHSNRFSFAFTLPPSDIEALPDMLREVRTIYSGGNAFRLDKEKGEIYLAGQPRHLTEGSIPPRGPYLDYS